MRILGIDYGEKKTGLALGDSETKIASPIELISGGKQGIIEVSKIAVDEAIDLIVVGLPKEGSHNFNNVELFVESIKAATDLPVETIEEAFTSKEGRRLQTEGATASEDSLAAMLILQDYFSSK